MKKILIITLSTLAVLWLVKQTNNNHVMNDSYERELENEGFYFGC